MSVQGIFTQLLTSSLWGAALIGAVWALCRLFPRTPAAVRSGLWWIATFKLLLGLAPMPSLTMPAMPPHVVPAAIEMSRLRPREVAQSVGGPLTRMVGDAARSSVGTKPVRSVRSIARRAQQMPWRSIALSVWIAGAVFGLLRLRGQLHRQRRLLQTAEDWRDPYARSILVTLSDALGLRRTPRVVVSDEVETPQVTGLVAPVVLLPRHLAHELSRSECAMTLCHELVHVRRRDLWMGWVPALAERVFWFHPLARLATHEYALAREAACDAEVLEVLDEAPQDYGRMLVRLGTARASGLATAGVAPTARTLKRRLLMLQQVGSGGPRRLAWAAFLALALLAIVPLRFRDQPRAGLRVEPGPPEVLRDDFGTARGGYYEVTPEACGTCTNTSELESNSERESIQADAANGDPWGDPNETTVYVDGDLAIAVDPQEVATPAPMPDVPGEAQATAPRAYAYSYGYGGSAGTPAPPAAYAPSAFYAYRDQIRQAQRELVAARAAGRSYSVAGRGASGGAAREEALARALASLSHLDAARASAGVWAMDDRDRAWVLVKGDSMMTGSGSTPDFRRAKSVRRHSGRDEIFFLREGDAEFVIEDPGFIASAWGLFQRDSEASRRQEELSARQAELGVQQGELGRQQAEFGLRQAELSVEIAKLQVSLLRAGDDSREARRLQSHMDELNEKMGEFAERQADLGEQQAELGEQQAELGEEQSRLGEETGEESVQVEEELWKRIEEAREAGLARELE